MKSALSPEMIRTHKGTSFVGVTTCFICHDGAGNIFMAKRSPKARDEQGTWDIGGGGLDWGLTAEDNVRKEVEEEYSAKPKKIDFLGFRDVFRILADGTPTHWVALDFAVRIDPNEAKINEPDKFDASGWFTLETLPTPLHSQNLNTLNTYKTKLLSIWHQ